MHGNIAKGGGNMKTMKQVDIGLAIRAIIETCMKCPDCSVCPITEICDNGSPLDWNTAKIPEIGEFIALQYQDER